VRKIAIIQRFLPSRSRGGVGHFTHGLATALASRGNDVTVFSQDPAPAGAAYNQRHVPVRDSRLAPLAFPFALRRCDFSGFDVIHAQGDEQWLSRRGNPPVVRTMHGTALAEAWFNGVIGRSPKRFLLHLYFYAMEFIADLRANRVITVSTGTGRYYPRAEAVIPNGIDVERISEIARDQQKSAVPSILFVGELDSRKRGRWLVDVFSRVVRPAVPNAELWLVSPDKADGPGIVLHGAPDNDALAALLARAWVMCLPSAYEGFGRPYGEAMAAGTAVVATSNPGSDEVLQNGQYGVIAEDASLGDALVRLLTDARERERLAQLARARAEDFTWTRVAAAYERVYDDVIAERAS
jgi:phosphatidylinositol alpha-mannosyltransferase